MGEANVLIKMYFNQLYLIVCFKMVQNTCERTHYFMSPPIYLFYLKLTPCCDLPNTTEESIPFKIQFQFAQPKALL